MAEFPRLLLQEELDGEGDSEHNNAGVLCNIRGRFESECSHFWVSDSLSSVLCDPAHDC